MARVTDEAHAYGRVAHRKVLDRVSEARHEAQDLEPDVLCVRWAASTPLIVGQVAGDVDDRIRSAARSVCEEPDQGLEPGANGQWQNVIRKWEGDTRSFGIYLHLDRGTFCYTGTYGESYGSWTDHCGSFSAWDGRYHHLAVTYSAYEQALRLYVDGVLESTARPPPGGLTLTSGPVEMMRAVPGEIDQVRIYHRQLDGAEVRALYDSENPAPADCPVPP
jgi:hypothetical protein